MTSWWPISFLNPAPGPVIPLRLLRAAWAARCFPSPKEASSMLKGESFYDTVKTFSQYVDAIIIRHSEDNYYEELIGKIPVPLINGGDCRRTPAIGPSRHRRPRFAPPQPSPGRSGWRRPSQPGCAPPGRRILSHTRRRSPQRPRRRVEVDTDVDEPRTGDFDPVDALKIADPFRKLGGDLARVPLRR